MTNKKKLNIVLAGQANVGKSVIFNHLTGLHQHIGNWPGKTVEKAEGTLFYKGHTIDVLDLPGIYSLTTYSIEESVSREYIALQKPDFVINVVDATNLERNLIFTIQLLELGRPTVLALNMVNLSEEKGIEIDIEKLEKLLGIPVVPVVAIHKKGITETLDKGLELIERREVPKPLKYGEEIEARIKKLILALKDVSLPYPKRWLAIKLLEKDKEIEGLVKEKDPSILEKAKKLCKELEKIHGHDASLIISNERCSLAFQITREVTKIVIPKKISLMERIDAVTSHKILGYPAMIGILGLMFLAVFKFGDWLSSFLEFGGLQNWWEGVFGVSSLSLLAFAGVESALALIQLALPYILPFYFLLYFLEDWGYLARVSFLADSLMHKLGVHGKACIPLILGFGCNVPACLSCRIMETERERFITGFLTTLIPCSAVTVVVLGLVGKFMGLGWVLGLYAFVILVVFIIGKLISKILPGEPVELIMEMPDYRRPHLKTILLQTWFRLKEFIFIAGPLVIISGVIIKGLYLGGFLNLIVNFLTPITVTLLGLPAITGVLLIFGILRKELILVMLATLLGTTNFIQVLTPFQMITLSLVTIFYIPCIATIAALCREFGWKKALSITVFEIFFAIAIAASVPKILLMFL